MARFLLDWQPRRQLFLGVVACLLIIAVALVWWVHRRSANDAQWMDSLPAQTHDNGYVSSDVCRSCHPQQYASWYATYHRTMTQIATSDTVVGRFDNVTLAAKGHPYRLYRQGEEFWVELDDPDWRPEKTLAELRQLPRRFRLFDGVSQQPPRVQRRVVMVTGSHHQQRYWLASSKGRRLDLLPFAYLIAEQRWVPGAAIFLTYPHVEHGLHEGAWNTNCLACHSVGGQPRPAGSAEQPETQVGELGIACEACHGPGAEHVRANHNPQRRYRLYLSGAPDPTIVHPGRLSAPRSSQVCGQCHAVYRFKQRQRWLHEGSQYRPGDDLEHERHIIRYTTTATEPWLQSWLTGNPTKMEQRFWPDGTIRVSGREYNGLIASGCFQRGDLSCLSCHAMHASDPDDQLRAGMDGDHACLQCHAPYQEQVQVHTHHTPDSPGSRCYNCHMPHTTFGLLRAMRSHRIDSPSAATSATTGRPNACNLCHLDKSLAWTATYLSDWYGAPAVTLHAQAQAVSATLLWLLQGDAVQRAVAAWSMGWEPAQQASGSGWQAPFLADLLTDPYAAVRFNAHRSLQRLPGYADFTYDYVGPEEERRRAKVQALDIWKRERARTLDRTGSSLLIAADGSLLRAALDRLVSQRNDRRIRLAE